MKRCSAVFAAVLLGLPVPGRAADAPASLDLRLPADVVARMDGGSAEPVGAAVERSLHWAAPLPPASGPAARGSGATGALPYGAGYEARHPGGMRGMRGGRGR